MRDPSLCTEKFTVSCQYGVELFWYGQRSTQDNTKKMWEHGGDHGIIAPKAVGQGAPQAINACHAGHYERLRGAEQMSACG